MVCSSCGRALEVDMQYCGACGRRQSTQQGAIRESARRAAVATGRTLRELCEGTVLLDWRQTFEILVATCNAVADVRARGAELSLEPGSFYIENQADRWVVTVLDADVADTNPHDTDVMRAPPPWIGSNFSLYWAPEKLMGKPVHDTADVYSLGVIGFELVTGQRPFDDATSVAALLTAQMKNQLPAPSTLRPEAEIPRAADAVLLACIQKFPDKRYPDVRMLGQAISHVLAVEHGIPAAPGKRPPLRVIPSKIIRPPPAAVTVLEGETCGSATCTTRHLFRGPAYRTIVGSWLYLDHFDSLISKRPDFSPHPHVGTAVLTYLFEGRLVHRDSLGNDQKIKPNMVGWLHAGRGVVHSDRRDPADDARGGRLHGLELWVVLPRPNEDDPPQFAVHPTGELPSVVISGVRVRVVLGEGFGAHSPVVTPSPLSMFDVRIPKAAGVPLPSPRHHDYQRAVYVVSGAVEIHGMHVEARQLAVIAPTASVGITAIRDAPAHVVILGSAPSVGPRHSWWYFSATSTARLEEARQRYLAGAFGAVPGDPKPPQLPTK